MPRNGDRAELWFEASPPVPGTARTVFARTRGWYELHLHNTSRPPDADELAKLAGEPGWIVREAIRELAALRRTGELRGVDPARATGSVSPSRGAHGARRIGGGAGCAPLRPPSPLSLAAGSFADIARASV